MAGKFVCVEDYEKHAISVLPAAAFNYYKSGADHEQTLEDNKKAFKRYILLFITFKFDIKQQFKRSWRLMPRMLRGVQQRSMSTTALGFKVSFPIGIGLLLFFLLKFSTLTILCQ